MESVSGCNSPGWPGCAGRSSLLLSPKVHQPQSPGGCGGAGCQGRLVGEGFHARAGNPTPNLLLAQAGDAARGGTIIVTLDPAAITAAPRPAPTP